MSDQFFDFEKSLQSALSRQSNKGNKSYFVMSVVKVAQSPSNPDEIKVAGVRLDTDQKVVVTTNKAASGQRLPEIGGVMRADKVKRTSVKGNFEDYTSEYFHAYPKTDFCLEATAMPMRPRDRNGDGRFSANVVFADHAVGTKTITVADLVGPQGASIIREHLKPWTFQDRSSITHDVSGKSLWDNPIVGATPMLMVRIGIAYDAFVYGASVGFDGDRKPALPADSRIEQSIANSRKLNNLIEGIKVAVPNPENQKAVPVELIPLLQVSVGRDCLGGLNEHYLGAKAQFEARGVFNANVDEASRERRVWRTEALSHLRVSRTGRLQVVDLVPGAGRTYMNMPLTDAEQAYKELRDSHRKAEQADSPVSGASAAAAPAADASHATPARDLQHNPESSHGGTQNNRQPEPAPVQQYVQEPPAHVEDDYAMADESYASFDDMDQYAQDMAAMESMNSDQHNGAGDDFDDMLLEAEQRLAQRRFPSPGM